MEVAGQKFDSPVEATFRSEQRRPGLSDPGAFVKFPLMGAMALGGLTPLWMPAVAIVTGSEEFGETLLQTLAISA